MHVTKDQASGLIPPNRSAIAPDVDRARELVDQIIGQAGQIILGKDEVLRQAMACLLARGHLLIEDLPGIGKTVLAHTLAACWGLQFSRVQFTSDLLPADIIGISTWDRGREAFCFHPGPVFNQVVLADEINRATPKTQSALLEAMEEHQVTVEGQSRPLPEPFFVIATQNPQHQIGTFALPESQLDRFLMRLQVGFPDADAERRLLKGRDRRSLLQELKPQTDPQRLVELQTLVGKIHCSDALVDYLQKLLHETRVNSDYRHGLSPRAGVAILQCARAWALMQGREFVLPEDIQVILPPVTAHRLGAGSGHAHEGLELCQRLLASVPVT